MCVRRGRTVCEVEDAMGWQCYSAALPRWTESLIKKGFQEGQAENIARRIARAWPGASAVGLFALHTTAAKICAGQLGPWLAGRWFRWILPLAGASPQGFATDYYLQHLELANIIAALVVAYVICRKFQRLGAWAWVLPTVIISCKLFTFTDPHASLLAAANPWSRFSYYFVIERFMPTLYDLRGSDPARVVEQITVVAPFYSGIAYNMGALAQKHEGVERIIRSLRRQREPELFPPDEAGVEVIVDADEQPIFNDRCRKCDPWRHSRGAHDRTVESPQTWKKVLSGHAKLIEVSGSRLDI